LWSSVSEVSNRGLGVRQAKEGVYIVPRAMATVVGVIESSDEGSAAWKRGRIGSLSDGGELKQSYSNDGGDVGRALLACSCPFT
jgi:hypothetical protein